MSRAALHITRTQVNRWFLVQLAAIVIAALVLGWLKGLFFAQSIFIGGFICLIPQWIFAKLWLAYYKASQAPKLVKMFYIGEVIKLILTCVLFILALVYLPVTAVGCLIGFIIAQVAFWIAPLILKSQKIQHEHNT